MITLYKATTYSNTIEKISAERQTTQSYFIKTHLREKRKALRGESFAAFKFEPDAIEWKRQFLLSRTRKAYDKIAKTGHELDEFKATHPKR